MVYETEDSKEHLNPWFDDGNVILVAEGKCFKVYQGMLSVHSPIFRDMLSCPQPVGQEEMDGEGCPVVHLRHDSASEVQQVLRALFYGEYITLSPRLMPMSVATTLLRLGKKYEIKPLFNHVSARVKACYHSELPSDSGPLRFEGTISERDPHDFQLLNIAREVGLLSVLPIALYVCASSTEIKKLLDGYEWEGVHYSLSPINQRACIIGRDHRSALAKRAFAQICETQGDRYFVGNTACKKSFEGCPAQCCPTSLPTDPFALWDTHWDSRFCGRCVTTFKFRYDKGRKDAFLSLPSMFDLGLNWDEVRKDETSF
ncbi:hypothetical protein BKA82DRAFT_996951 [Pisolithus tinctorius]|uniref:BTB domain-containing protein n=1 Tax=Pisolithus tinctorius Marx 270 TaxID=870435 RepID=A0A0C3PJD1_PISTI|nr:hypothetical protein BKA82DRAFT_996951 [Pisolithus tinctorius]KIO08706.1 hypothetical protein M404DRAFT_996951 [Pisolithus tinctorius Marx 270]